MAILYCIINVCQALVCGDMEIYCSHAYNNDMENTKDLYDECESLGIIGIVADNMSPQLVRDVLEAVKEADLDFKTIAKRIEKERTENKANGFRLCTD